MPPCGVIRDAGTSPPKLRDIDHVPSDPPAPLRPRGSHRSTAPLIGSSVGQDVVVRRSPGAVRPRRAAGAVTAAAPRARAPRSTMGMMRRARKALAMAAVTFAFASSVAYVIPNAQGFEPAAVAEESGESVVQLQALEPVDGSVVAAAIARDGFGITLPPPPPPPPPKVVSSTRASTGGVQSFALVPSSSSAELQWPIPAGTKIASGFGPRSCGGCSSNHQGIDFQAPSGSPAWSMAAGVVIEAGGSGPFGTHAVVQHLIDGEVVTTLYAHFLAGSLQVAVGDTVTAGQPLGAVGCTGSCTGTHLHFEVHPSGGAAVDPMPWISSRIGG